MSGCCGRWNITAPPAKSSASRRRLTPARKALSFLILGLDFPERAQLYRRIDLRVNQMLEAGLLNEAKRVWEHRDTYKTAAQAIGYKEFFPYFAGRRHLPLVWRS